jgi:UDP-N-acetylglucosamine 2-epimerase (hydrolysing)
MILNKRILFLSGTRADFGKIKSLILKLNSNKMLDIYIFVTGMHLSKIHGSTYKEIEKLNLSNIEKFNNQDAKNRMDITLANTIYGLNTYINKNPIDLIIVHGDRIEALAGAIVGVLNNILVAHIEGGELSGTVDDLIRHSVSKLSHLHLVSNVSSKNRLLQLGENNENIYIIGSPDYDIMTSNKLPKLNDVIDYYQIPFNDYAILLFHPVTTEIDFIEKQALCIIESLIETNLNYLIIFPNNDSGSKKILKIYKKFENFNKFKFYPSIKFESFLTLLKNSNFIIGNSSAGIRESPFYNIPSINIGSRQDGRLKNKLIYNVPFNKEAIKKTIFNVNKLKIKTNDKFKHFGKKGSDEKLYKIICTGKIWNIKIQKKFIDL